MRKAFAAAALLASSLTAAGAGPCPVMAYRPGHEPKTVIRPPKQPSWYGSELEIQRRCNMWLNSFKPVVEFAPAKPPKESVTAGRPYQPPRPEGDGALGATIPAPTLETP